ncbi:hypothetical protein CPB85DRAFT_1318760 [Mucidula mucida]|nr:hypothetical protein CPB85DRAFT_1318760 [Mucidula mucida]
MIANTAENRINLDDPRYPPELYRHVRHMMDHLGTDYHELEYSDMFPVPISLCPTLGENSPVYCPICPPPNIETAFKYLQRKIYKGKHRLYPPLYKTEGAWIQHHWRVVHGNVVVPLPAPNRKVRQSRRGTSTELHRCPLYGTPSAKAGCERWTFKSINSYSDAHFHPVHCAIETRYMTDWPWQYGDLPWMTGQLPLAGEKLRDYIYRVVDPLWATIYADIVLAEPKALKKLVEEWRETDPDFARLFEAPSDSPMLRALSSLSSPESSVVTVDSPEYIIVD